MELTRRMFNLGALASAAPVKTAERKGVEIVQEFPLLIKCPPHASILVPTPYREIHARGASTNVTGWTSHYLCGKGPDWEWYFRRTHEVASVAPDVRTDTLFEDSNRGYSGIVQCNNEVPSAPGMSRRSWTIYPKSADGTKYETTRIAMAWPYDVYELVTMAPAGHEAARITRESFKAET